MTAREKNPTESGTPLQVGVSLVIPTLNASWDLPGLLERIERQTLAPEEVLVIDSSSDDETVEIAESHEGVDVVVIGREEFNHGLTRHEAFGMTTCEIVCFMTQDAMPADKFFLERLVAPLEDGEIAMSSGRQLPRPEAREFERLVRGFNYGGSSSVRSLSDVETLGIKAMFVSDVCAAYRRSAYLECGGFGRTDMSEDMLMAARFLRAGYQIAYAADARVYHSHNLSASQQYRRNKAIGYFLEQHRAEFGFPGEMGEGVALARYVLATLLERGHFTEAAAFGLDCAARFAGNRAGRGSYRRREVG